MKKLKLFTGWLFDPIDSASFTVFRVVFGFCLCLFVLQWFQNNWIEEYILAPPVHFTFFGFDWVKPWPGRGMYWHFYGLGLLSLGILFGVWPRLCSFFFCLGFTQLFLIDQAYYENHYYLICLLTFLLSLFPVKDGYIPRWCLLLLRTQFFIVYFYAGIAKCNNDWISGVPMGSMLAARANWPLIGPIFLLPKVVFFFVHGGLLFDLLVGPLLFWKRSRIYAFGAAVFFHLLNFSLFKIGIFPWMMIAGTSLFLSPSWPRGIFRWVDRRTIPTFSPSRWTTALVVGYVSFQALLPLRQHLYQGPVHWTELGGFFSWRMMVNVKEVRAVFFAVNPTNHQVWQIDPREYLNHLQLKQLSRPDNILQFSHFIRERLGGKVEVRANVRLSLNGRPFQMFIDPSRDLASEKRTLQEKDWILPFQP